jgi:hypothetical protein
MRRGSLARPASIAFAISDLYLLGPNATRHVVSVETSTPPVRDYRAPKGISSQAFARRLGSMPSLVPFGWRHVIVVGRPVQIGVARQVQTLRADADGENYLLAESLEEAWQHPGITAPEFAQVDL